MHFLVLAHTDEKMIELTRNLKIIEDVDLRNQLRTEAKLLVSAKNLLPPVNFGLLLELAEELIVKTGIDSEYLDFAIVLCGNEIWRNVIEAIPCNRRLLLLPQCLKHSINCKGETDSFGLTCAGCSSCSIKSILEEAEDLGYATLVAEGTSIAIRLVEEGAIDAVIGVSCMHVLQRSFEPVAKSAVPVIGLPLLKNGCENTQIDYNWVLDEIRSVKKDPDMQPLSVSVLKDQVQDYFCELNLQNIFYSDDVTEQLAKKMLMIGGQRIRPLLAALAYRSYTNYFSEEVQKLLAVIVECFHKASLIHDDIEDNDNFRYGKETLHKANGIPVAINVGDFLIGKGYQLLSNLKTDPDVLVKSLRVVSSSHLNLSKGQGSDLMIGSNVDEITLEQLLKIYTKKTGEAMKVALLLGAINGNAGEDELKRLSLFSDFFGIAYQIRDDLKEFREEESLKKKNFPFLMALLNAKINKNNICSIDEVRTMDSHQVRILLLEEKIDVEADGYLKMYVDKCYNELNQLKNLKMKLSLYNVTGKIF